MKSLRKQQTKINTKMPERGRAGKLQVFRAKNERFEAYQMNTGHFKRNGPTNSYLFLRP